jgi:hypothetical protein
MMFKLIIIKQDICVGIVCIEMLQIFLADSCQGDRCRLRGTEGQGRRSDSRGNLFCHLSPSACPSTPRSRRRTSSRHKREQQETYRRNKTLNI